MVTLTIAGRYVRRHSLQFCLQNESKLNLSQDFFSYYWKRYVFCQTSGLTDDSFAIKSKIEIID